VLSGDSILLSRKEYSLAITPLLFPRFLIEHFFSFVSKEAKILLYCHLELIKLQMSLMICLKQSSITTCYILTIKIKTIFKFFVKYTKEDRIANC